MRDTIIGLSLKFDSDLLLFIRVGMLDLNVSFLPPIGVSLRDLKRGQPHHLLVLVPEDMFDNRLYVLISNLLWQHGRFLRLIFQDRLL